MSAPLSLPEPRSEAQQSLQQRGGRGCSRCTLSVGLFKIRVTVQQTPAHVAIVFMPDNSAVDTQEVTTEALRSTLRNDKHRTNNSICSLDSRYDEVSHETRTQIFLIKKRRHCWKLWVKVYRINSIIAKYFLITGRKLEGGAASVQRSFCFLFIYLC